MKSVLITGGAGFIGSHLCTALLENNSLENLVVADNFVLGTRDNVNHLSSYSEFQVVEGDINNSEMLEGLFDKYRFDTVFHLAANSDISISHNSPSIDYNNTFNTTWTLLEAMRKFNCKKLIFASTSAIYGDTQEEIDENFGPLRPISHYGAGKLASEAFISSFAYNYEIQTWIFRFPNVVGKRSTHGIIYDFLKKLNANPNSLVVLGNGKQEKSYLHVSDLVNAILYCKSKYQDSYNVFNVGGIDTITVKRIAEIVLEETNSTQQIEFTGGDRGWIGDVPKFKYNIDKIKSTGWLPKLNSEQAIRQTVQELIGKL